MLKSNVLSYNKKKLFRAFLPVLCLLAVVTILVPVLVHFRAQNENFEDQNEQALSSVSSITNMLSLFKISEVKTHSSLSQSLVTIETVTSISTAGHSSSELTTLVTHKIVLTLQTTAVTRCTGVLHNVETDLITITSHSVQSDVQTSGVTTFQTTTSVEMLTSVEQRPTPTTHSSLEAGPRVPTPVAQPPATLTTTTTTLHQSTTSSGKTVTTETPPDESTFLSIPSVVLGDTSKRKESFASVDVTSSGSTSIKEKTFVPKPTVKKALQRRDLTDADGWFEKCKHFDFYMTREILKQFCESAKDDGTDSRPKSLLMLWESLVDASRLGIVRTIVESDTEPRVRANRFG